MDEILRKFKREIEEGARGTDAHRQFALMLERNGQLEDASDEKQVYILRTLHETALKLKEYVLEEASSLNPFPEILVFDNSLPTGGAVRWESGLYVERVPRSWESTVNMQTWLLMTSAGLREAPAKLFDAERVFRASGLATGDAPRAKVLGEFYRSSRGCSVYLPEVNPDSYEYHQRECLSDYFTHAASSLERLASIRRLRHNGHAPELEYFRLLRPLGEGRDWRVEL